jgi:hypothetical protein
VVVAESKGCLFLANDCNAHRGARRKVRTVDAEEGGSGKKVDSDAVSKEEEGNSAGGDVCTARDGAAKVDSVCISEKETGDAVTKKKKSMKVARVVKEDCVLALVVTLPESNKVNKEEVEQGEEGEKEEGSGVQGETQLQLLHRACRADITAENKKGSIIYLLHGEKCLPFCKGGIS